MAIPKRIRDAIPKIIPLSSDYDPYDGRFELYGSDACNFEVLDGGVWYKIDAMHPVGSDYERYGVPDRIQIRADAALESYWHSYDTRDDPTQAVEAILAEEFDDVRFVNMTYVPGRRVY